MALQMPDQVGPWRPVRLLGQGGMGQVYLGRRVSGGQLAAVKLVRPELASDTHFRARFAREVEALRRVRAPGVARLVDADLDGPHPWLATAFVPGPNLLDLVRARGPLPERTVRMLGRLLAGTLQALHAEGIVHRDIKPANILIGPDGPQLIDFGVVRMVEATTLTTTGITVGSPGFMAPEQIGGSAGPASDVFALGAVLAYAASGSGPFGMGHDPGLTYRVMEGTPDLHGVPDGLRSVLERCLAKDPAQRPTPPGLASELLHGGFPGDAPAASWLPADVLDVLWRAALDAAEVSDGAVPAPTRVAEAQGARRASRRRPRRQVRPLALVAATTAGAVVTAAGFIAFGNKTHEDTSASARLTPAPTTALAQATPSGFVGEWTGRSGPVWLDGGPQIAIDITTTSGPAGALVGRARVSRTVNGTFQELCNSSFRLKPISTLTDITVGPGGQPGDHGNCLDGDVVLAQRADGSIDWTGHAAGGATYQVSLRRR